MSALPNRLSIGGVSGGDGPLDNTVLSQNKILTLTFNQDCTALAMGTMKTYALFTINSDNNIDEIHNGGIEPINNIPYMPYEEVHILERLYSSSLIALVSRQARHKLKVCNFKAGSEMCSYAYSNTILTVKLNRSRLIVFLDGSIYIHDMRDMKVLHTIHDVPPNPDGLCALSITDSSPYLAYPGSSITGEIQIFDTINLRPSILISAHDGPLAAIAFDMSGTKIATASTKGTVIRIHSAVDGACLFEFRRGLRRVATIYSLAFSPDSMFLAASSNTGTIHIFRVTNQKEKPSNEQNTWPGYIISGIKDWLPKQTSEVLTQDRSFAYVHLQSVQMKSIIAMNILNKTLKLFVASYDGVICVYEVNTTDGGECKQISQHLLSDMSQNPNNQQNPTTNDRRNTVDGSGRIEIPSSVLRRENSTTPYLLTLTNEKHSDDHSFNTAIGDRSLPSLSSPPQVDNE